MIYKTISPLAGDVRVIVELPASLWADRIFAVGNFDQNLPSRIPLRPLDGHWRASLALPAGKQYHFRYWIDGE